MNEEHDILDLTPGSLTTVSDKTKVTPWYAIASAAGVGGQRPSSLTSGKYPVPIMQEFVPFYKFFYNFLYFVFFARLFHLSCYWRNLTVPQPRW